MPKSKKDTVTVETSAKKPTTKSKKKVVVTNNENAFSKKANLLKLQDDLLIDNSEDLIESIEEAMNIKWIESDDIENEFSETEFINNGEKEYIQSLKSSIYTEAFQKELLKMIKFTLDNINNEDVYKEKLSDMIMLIRATTTKSKLSSSAKDKVSKDQAPSTTTKSKLSNSDNMFITLNELLGDILNATKSEAKLWLSEIQEVIKWNIEKYKEINAWKKEIIETTLKAQIGDRISEGKVIDYMMNDINKSAKKISSFNSGNNGDHYLFDDLVQEWLIGVLRGILKFSPKKSDNVREYMKFWITQSMLSYITNKVHTIRIPAHVRSLYIKITRQIDEFAGENIEYSTKHIADQLGIDEEKVKTVLEKGKMGHVMNMSDLASYIGGEDEEMSADSMPFMADLSSWINEDMIVNEEIQELQSTIKTILTNEEQVVIIHRYWLFGSDKLLLKDLGEKLWKTEERVRQIEMRALNTLSIKYFDKKYGKSFRDVMKTQYA